MADTTTRRDLGWDELVAQIAERCSTTRGSERALAIAPLDAQSEAEALAAEVAEARLFEQRAESLPFGGIRDVGEVLQAASRGLRLDPESLIAVADLARGGLRLRDHIGARAEDAPRLWARAEAIADLSELFRRILDSFDGEGRLVDSASRELGNLRKRVARLQRDLEDRARSLLDDPKLRDELQDRFWTQRDDRYVVPIRADARSRVAGIIHGTSQSGHTLFVEPEAMVDMNNQLRLAECAVADEEERILAELSQLVRDQVAPLRSIGDVSAQLDAIAASARVAEELVACPPVFSNDAGIALTDIRHPLLLLAGKLCVANDIHLAMGSTLIVSGPNAGGKTVALKSTGLAALMARAGLHICAAPGSTLPWFSQVLTGIGDEQSIENDLSTFSAHLIKLRFFLQRADQNSLILIDELCGATEPAQGAAMAQACLERFSARGATAMVTTHYERLKTLGASGERFENASVGFDIDRMEPTFRLHLGVPGASGALALAQRLELDGDVIDRAAEILGEGSASVEELLSSVAAERDRLIEERGGLEEALAAAERARERAEAAEKRAREKVRELHERSHSEAIGALREARREIDSVRKGIRRRRPDEIRAAEKRIDNLAREVREHRPEVELPGRPAAEGELARGTRVFVPSLGGRGVVMDAPKRGKVQVQLGALKTTVEAGEVRIEAGGAAPKSKPRRGPSRGSGRKIELAKADDEGRAVLRTPDTTLDLRGERVHESIEALERFLDDSLLAERETIFIIHGHGTGALRDAVRSHLRGHAAVSKWRPGEPSEGGDGVTVAWIDS